jgi:hypothetical protein
MPIPNSADSMQMSSLQPYLLMYQIHLHTPPCALLIRPYVSTSLYSCRLPKACCRILRSFNHLDLPYFQRYEGRWQLVSADHTVAGGNVNVSDEDGDTPLYTVENIETARFLVDNGADHMWRNKEGLTVCQNLVIHTSLLRPCQPAASLEEDFPQVADYLNSLTATLTDSHDGEAEDRDSSQLLSQRSQEAASERLTSSLMSQLSDLAQNEPIGDESHRDEELRQTVSHVVLESLVTGYTMANRGTDSTTHTHSDETDGQR